MPEKAVSYGYKKVGFILDRGYFCKENVQHMDRCDYDFAIMVKGMFSFVRELILENRGKSENVREYGIRQYRVFEMTVKNDVCIRYVFYSDARAVAEHEKTESKIDSTKK